MSLTTSVREELAHVPVGPDCCDRAEVSAALRLGGTFRRAGGDPAGFGLVLETPSGAVARRLHAALRRLTDHRPDVAVLEPGGLRPGRAYRIELPAAGRAGPLVALGVVDGEGRPRDEVPNELTSEACDWRAYLRGALLTSGTVSDPSRAAHLEIRTASEGVASGVRRLMRGLGLSGARVSAHRDAWRVTLKSGEGIADLLAATGAHSAFLTLDQALLRRDLRRLANREANADRANLARAAAASARQAEAIERLVRAHGWDAVDEDLREVALARLANPEASLAELGTLLDPPQGKSAVHRRLQRLLALAEEAGEPDVR